MVPPSALVACNIYVTAAASHSSTLLSLLRRAQVQCRQHRLQGGVAEDEATHSNNDVSANDRVSPVALVHAYADIPYGRSSFHLAGSPRCVADVASALICNALSEIEFNDSKSARHPFVGLVDHVSVMPLAHSMDNGPNVEEAASAACNIGKQISKTNLTSVHYYGRACPNNTTLATVRRERTSFFHCGARGDSANVGTQTDATGDNQSTKPPTAMLKGDTTIGTPAQFVENFNIRLTSNVSFNQAKTLTQYLRGRNLETKGFGVPGVEALTLPYVRCPSEGGRVYEVACNLTNPTEGGVKQVRTQLDKWIEMQKQQFSDEVDENSGSVFNFHYFVEDAYPVGTTEKQCLEVLSGKGFGINIGTSSSKSFWDEYDKVILNNFEAFLKQN
ncbi:hypothetical protein ACHAWF_008845 [Thalassiosira exigua]